MTPDDPLQPPTPRDLSEVNCGHFQQHLGDSFTTTFDDLQLQLIEAASFGSKIDPETGKPFSCIFCGPEAQTLSQGIYDLGHPELGSLSLFLVPIGPNDQGMQYEAVFT
jgi:hypothetical protein